MICLLIVFAAFASAKEFYQYSIVRTGEDKKITGYSVFEVDKCYRITLTTYQLISQKNGETAADEGKYFFNTFSDKECKTLSGGESATAVQYTIEGLKGLNIFEAKPAESNKCVETAVNTFADDKCTEVIPATSQFVCNQPTEVKTCNKSGDFYVKTSVVHGYQGTFYYSDEECQVPTGYVENQRKCGVCGPLSASFSKVEDITYTKVACENDC
ncbi:hypothetical protein EDI_083080 [Entamoeba dispar SAW760]|uniref:Uncharacterized protein n=1 Tax=Entamoeba dispar (strain ATCC PRA-260 / SAW760) TaxID=370354 RepID=B0EKJ0_ENTDS|nr:uncharacterized protein EDI_083080 [Entamoeba dispar SAW760]EDR24955.1 hypothetical protein EDI_083080 [Entamoeba dispar SAW760]|eukprot:EDR24955.1 hypothetical protein EDI_083080 [Entamoeba dispar SAW760]